MCTAAITGLFYTYMCYVRTIDPRSFEWVDPSLRMPGVQTAEPCNPWFRRVQLEEATVTPGG